MFPRTALRTAIRPATFRRGYAGSPEPINHQRGVARSPYFWPLLAAIALGGFYYAGSSNPAMTTQSKEIERMATKQTKEEKLNNPNISNGPNAGDSVGPKIEQVAQESLGQLGVGKK